MNPGGYRLGGTIDDSRYFPRRWVALIMFRSVVGRLRSRATIGIRSVCQSRRSPVAMGRAEATVKAYLY
jgi:hypothetical protein